MKNIISFAILLFALVGFLGCSQADPRPNIVLLMSDDHGWNEVGYNNHPHLNTPVLDEMARSGLRFDRFYSGHPSCSPTRASYMTGRHPNRMGTFAACYSLRPEEITIAKLLGNAGYATAHFGKWHLGPVKAESPTNPGAMGFDTYLSADNFFGYNPKLSRDGAPPEEIPGEGSMVVIEEAIDFIKESKQKKKPSLTVVWFGSPHNPYNASDWDMQPYKLVKNEELERRFGEITAMDRAIGRMRDFLSESGLRENTLLWYCSDNGAPYHKSEWEYLRATKGSIYEGGIRVPAVLEWPSRVPYPGITEVPVVTSDILPTLCEIAGVPVPERSLDGVSVLPLIEGNMKERSSPIFFWKYDSNEEPSPMLSWDNEKRAIVYSSAEPWIEEELQKGTTPSHLFQGLQFANYKHPVAQTEGFLGRTAVVGNRYKLIEMEPGVAELYDITKDPYEKSDIASEHPEVVKELRQKLHDWQRSVEISLTGADYEK